MAIWVFFDEQMGKKQNVIFVVCPDQGAGNDPLAFGSAFHQGPTSITAYNCKVATNLGH